MKSLNLKNILFEQLSDQEQNNVIEKFTDIILPEDKKVVLQAGSDTDPRGLIVKWRSDGGYDVQYWYGTPNNVVAAELRGDGESFGHITDVYLGYHPEIDDEKN
jgi:hypothetical protein